MYKVLFVGICVFGFFFHAQADSVSIEVNAGILSNATGTPLPDNGLLQLVVSQSGTFTAPTANSFVTGDNYIAYQFAVNGSTTSGVNGETDTPITLTLSSNIVAGEAAVLRWFPGLTTASTSPGTADTTYGQFRSNKSEGIGDSSWNIPASGTTVTFAFTTKSSDEGGLTQTPWVRLKILLCLSHRYVPCWVARSLVSQLPERLNAIYCFFKVGYLR